jgi:hypothetical protein
MPADAYAPLRNAVADLGTAAKDGADAASRAASAAQEFAGQMARLGSGKDPMALVRNAVRAVEQGSGDLLGEATLTGQLGKEAGPEVSALRRTRQVVKHLLEGDDPRAAAEAAVRYSDAAQALADRLGRPLYPVSFDLPGGPASPALLRAATARLDAAEAAMKAANKPAEDALKMGAFGELLRTFPRTPEEFLGMTQGRAEKLFAALDAALGHGAPELASRRAAVEGAVDKLTEAVGVTSDQGTPVTRLRAARRAAQEARGKVAEAAREAEKRAAGAARAAAKAAKQEAKRAQTSIPGPPTEPKAPEGPWGRVTHLARTAARGYIGASIGTALGHPHLGWALAAELMGARAAATEGITRAAATWGSRAGSALALAAPRALALGRNAQQDFEAKVAEMRRMAVTARDSGYLSSRVLASAGHGNFAAAAHAVALNAVGVLAAALPREPDGTRWALKSIYQVPAAERDKLMRVARAVLNPIASMKAMAAGDVHPAEARALEAAWPAVFAQFRSLTLERLADPAVANKMSAPDLAAMGTAIRSVTVPTVRPQFIAAQAMMYASRPPIKAGPVGGGKPGRPAGPASGPDTTRAQFLTER